MCKYCQENKKRQQKQLVKDVKFFLKKEKKECNNMVATVRTSSRKMKKINWWSIEKIYKMRKNTLL